jgi:hypothetical protein
VPRVSGKTRKFEKKCSPTPRSSSKQQVSRTLLGVHTFFFG